MNLIQQFEVLQRLHRMLRTHRTGDPDLLAQRLNLSKRSLFRMIDELRDVGLPIAYCRDRKTYYYAQEVNIKFEITIDEKALLRIRGGTAGTIPWILSPAATTHLPHSGD
jgi:predicted DNA-binding transcriptional regulator YafY